MTISKIKSNPQLFRSVAALFSSNMVASLLGFAGGIITARILGPEENGLFKSFTIPLTYLTFLHLGTFDGLWRQIPYYVGKKMPDEVNALASSAGAWNILVSRVVTAGFMACALYSLWRGDFFGAAGWTTQAVCCWWTFYGGYLGATYRTIHQFEAFARITLVGAFLNFVLIATLPFLRFYGLCVRIVSTYIYEGWLCHRDRPLKVKYKINKKILFDLIKLGFPFSFWGTLFTSIWIATESALILKFGGMAALGFFAVASVLRDGVGVLPHAFHQVMMPRVVESYAKDGSIRNAFGKTVWLTFGLTTIMVFVVFFISYLADILIPIALPKYVDGIPLIKLCLWYAVIQPTYLPFNTLFAKGNQWIFGRGVLAGFIVFPLASYFLIPVFGGVIAVAVGSLLGRIVRMIVSYIDIYILIRQESK